MVDPNERISIEEALDRVLSRVGVLGGEKVALDDALGRVLAADVKSDIDCSPFDNSAMASRRPARTIRSSSRSWAPSVRATSSRGKWLAARRCAS